MATKKPKVSTKKAAASKSKSVSKVKTASAVVTTKTVESKKTSNKLFKGFFAKKYPENESILTIFKNPKFYGALIGEIIGVLLLTLVFFALALMNIVNVAVYAFVLIAIIVTVYAISGAQLNPIVTVGMMVTRRMSVIRGVMYIIAQIVGAWLGYVIFNAFVMAAGDATTYTIPAMAEIAEGKFWHVAFVELLGAIIIAFAFARALTYKRSALTFAATVAGGLCMAVLIGYVVSAAFLGLSSNFIFNPAMAMMYQIFPTVGESFGEVFGGIMQALSAYALIPMIGGVVGFYIADFAGKLSGEEL